MIKEQRGASGDPYYKIADEIALWTADDGGSIHIKITEPHGDPVEFSEEEAIELIEILSKLVAQMRQ